MVRSLFGDNFFCLIIFLEFFDFFKYQQKKIVTKKSPNSTEKQNTMGQLGLVKFRYPEFFNYALP